MPDPPNINIMLEIQAFSLKHDGNHDKILRKRSGFSLFLKMRHFLKLKNINIMQEIQYFLEGSVRAGPPTYSYYAGNTSFFVEARWQTWQHIKKMTKIFLVFENIQSIFSKKYIRKNGYILDTFWIHFGQKCWLFVDFLLTFLL